VYFESSNIYYINSTDDYNKRLISHNTSDRITFTSKHCPYKLVAVFIVRKSRSQDILLERVIKKQKIKTLIGRLINPTFIPSIKLAHLVESSTCGIN